jgi:hypothetical protein
MPVMESDANSDAARHRLEPLESPLAQFVEQRLA